MSHTLCLRPRWPAPLAPSLYGTGQTLIRAASPWHSRHRVRCARPPRFQASRASAPLLTSPLACLPIWLPPALLPYRIIPRAGHLQEHSVRPAGPQVGALAADLPGRKGLRAAHAGKRPAQAANGGAGAAEGGLERGWVGRIRSAVAGRRVALSSPSYSIQQLSRTTGRHLY